MKSNDGIWEDNSYSCKGDIKCEIIDTSIRTNCIDRNKTNPNQMLRILNEKVQQQSFMK
jgi:hypothetical protein